MKRWSFAVLGALLVTCPSVARTEPASDEIDRLLPRLVRVASLYRDSALQFDCEEKITYTVFGEGKHAKTFAYLFVYDDEEGFLDYRLTRRQVKKERVVEGVNPEDYGIGLFLEQAYLFTMRFSEERMPFYEYSLEGEDRVLGRRAIRLLAAPIPPMREEVNDWLCWFWIDGETTQILKVVAYQGESAVAWTTLQADLARAENEGEDFLREHLIEKVTTEFGIEKNGMRFPSRAEIRVDTYEVRGGRSAANRKGRRLARIEQVYSDYRFFEIKTEAEITAYVEGSDD